MFNATCVPFDMFNPTPFFNLIRGCASKRYFGCQIKDCPGGAECANPDNPFEACGNDKVVFREMSADLIDPINFLIDVNAPPLKVQYYFLVDTSSSMAPHLGMVKGKINELMEMYERMSTHDAKFALGEYRDRTLRGGGGACGLRHVQGFTKDTERMKNAVDGLSPASGTHSGPENLLPSLAQIAVRLNTGGWDPQARKIVVVFGDAPGYEQNGHDLPLPNPLTREIVTNMLKGKDISVIGVSIGAPGLDGPTMPSKASRSAGPGQISFIARETGGTVTSPTKTLMQAIIEAKEGNFHEYTMNADDCTRFGLVVNDGKECKVRLKPSEMSTVDMNMMLTSEDGICVPFKCNITFQEDGIDLMPMGMEILKVNGCPQPDL